MKLLTRARQIVAPLLVVAGLCIPQAHAGLIGDEINATWTFDPFFIDSNTFVAADGVDLINSFGLDGDLDVKDFSIEVLFDNTSAIGNGVRWLFQDLDIDIVDAFVATDYIGWDDSFFGFGAGFASVDFLRDVSFAPDRSNYFEIFFDVDNQAPVPLPGSLSLLLAGIVLLARRRRQTPRI